VGFFMPVIRRPVGQVWNLSYERAGSSGNQVVQQATDLVAIVIEKKGGQQIAGGKAGQQQGNGCPLPALQHEGQDLSHNGLADDWISLELISLENIAWAAGFSGCDGL
jgi:hypothetical protein